MRDAEAQRKGQVRERREQTGEAAAGTEEKRRGTWLAELRGRFPGSPGVGDGRWRHRNKRSCRGEGTGPQGETGEGVEEWDGDSGERQRQATVLANGRRQHGPGSLSRGGGGESPQAWRCLALTQDGLHGVRGCRARALSLCPAPLTVQVLLYQQVGVALAGQLGQFTQGVLIAHHQLLLGGLSESFRRLSG